MSIEEIAKAIGYTQKQTRPIMIGIDGFGGSGKTTFANKLKDLLGSAYVISIDEFIVKEKIGEPSWDKGYFDRDRLEEQVLIPAGAGRPVTYQELQWATNTLSEPKEIPPVDYLIIEGISCYHPDIAHYYDRKIWVDTPIEIAKARGKARDAGNENEDKWDIWANNDLAYQQEYHPERVADFIINNSSLDALTVKNQVYRGNKTAYSIVALIVLVIFLFLPTSLISTIYYDGYRTHNYLGATVSIVLPVVLLLAALTLRVHWIKAIVAGFILGTINQFILLIAVIGTLDCGSDVTAANGLDKACDPGVAIFFKIGLILTVLSTILILYVLPKRTVKS